MLGPADLHVYQDRSVTEIYERGSVMGIVPMGGGKTASYLTATRELQRDGVTRGGIILAPKAVAAGVWRQEAAKWSHLSDMEVVLVAGTPAQREKLLNSAASLHVVGIDNTQWLVEQMADWPDDDPRLDALGIDEISRYKNPMGKRSRALVLTADRFDNRVGLTGTPMPNSEADLYMPARLISRKTVWPEPFLNWRMKYFMPDDVYTQLTWSIREDYKQQIHDDAARFSFTVDPSELPPTPELRTIEHWVELPYRARDAYRDMMRHLVAEVGGDVVEALNRAVASGKLDQIAQGYIYKDGETLEILHDAKLRKLADLVGGLGGEQAIITYWFREDLDQIKTLLGDDIPVLGSDTGEAEMEAHIGHWNAGRTPLMAVHPASAGHGLNLQESSAGQIIHYCPTWSPELYDQVNARLVRQGSKAETVMNHLILAEGTTDSLKRDRVRGKQLRQSDFIAHVRAA